jgi:hypothetical protein
MYCGCGGSSPLDRTSCHISDPNGRVALTTRWRAGVGPVRPRLASQRGAPSKRDDAVEAAGAVVINHKANLKSGSDHSADLQQGGDRWSPENRPTGRPRTKSILYRVTEVLQISVPNKPSEVILNTPEQSATATQVCDSERRLSSRSGFTVAPSSRASVCAVESASSKESPDEGP